MISLDNEAAARFTVIEAANGVVTLAQIGFPSTAETPVAEPRQASVRPARRPLGTVAFVLLVFAVAALAGGAALLVPL